MNSFEGFPVNVMAHTQKNFRFLPRAI